MPTNMIAKKLPGHWTHVEFTHDGKDYHAAGCANAEPGRVSVYQVDVRWSVKRRGGWSTRSVRPIFEALQGTRVTPPMAKLIEIARAKLTEEINA